MNDISWHQHLSNLSVMEDRLIENKVFDLAYLEQFKQILQDNKDLFDNLKTHAYLDDITTKNVIINNGKFSGIIDIDFISHGDSLMTLALTKMSLLKSSKNTDYVDYWVDELNLSVDDKKRLNIYTLRYCLDFMSEIGCIFNGNNVVINHEEVKIKLESIFERLMKDINND